MKFKITDCDFKPVYQGQIIQYTVRPLLNIPLKWVTEITHVVNDTTLWMNKGLDHIHYGITNTF